MIDPGRLDATEFVREFRRNYVNLFNLWTNVDRRVPDGVTLQTPAQKPIREQDLSPDLRAASSEYRERRGGVRITWTKYMRTVNGRPEEVIEDERPLPEESRLISVSRTSTLLTDQEVRVITELVVGEVEPLQRETQSPRRTRA